MADLYNYIFSVITLPTGFEFLEPLIFIYFLSLGLLLAFSFFKRLLDIF